MKIYTRTGDDGTTGLYFGGRVRKDSERPEAYGHVDELQAVLGVARAAITDASPGAAELDELLIGIQHDLWVTMADLATAPENRHKLTPGSTSVTPEMVATMEPLMDDITTRFDAPNGFVVPGGSQVGAALDVARTVARRAERAAISVGDEGSLVVPYLNRLSDLLWTLARWQDGTSRPVRTTESLKPASDSASNPSLPKDPM